MRICITGSPRSGKTTLSKSLGVEYVYHTDDYLQDGWSECSDKCSWLLETKGDWVMEGVAVPRAIRKWLKRHAGDNEKPCDKLVWFPEPVMPLTRGQETMYKGVITVMRGIQYQLLSRGVVIEQKIPERMMGGAA